MSEKTFNDIYPLEKVKSIDDKFSEISFFNIAEKLISFKVENSRIIVDTFGRQAINVSQLISVLDEQPKYYINDGVLVFHAVNPKRVIRLL